MMKELVNIIAILATLLLSHVRCEDCIDDEKVDCAMLTSMFGICTVNIENAAKFCPKTCNLCYLSNGNWAEWSSRSSCTVTCGNTTRLRTRSCTNPPPVNNGKDCEGPSSELNPCVLEPCPVDGSWVDWSIWSSCTVTCGNTTKSRTRSCTNPPPANNGTDCEGPSEEYTSCMLEPCPVPVGWGPWSEWESCSATCGVGIQHSHRSCNNQFGRFKYPCIGESTDEQICMLRSCADGEWTTWSSWSTCSVTCDIGLHQRSRDCTNPSPSPYGRLCTGPNVDFALCNNRQCPRIAGEWSEWTDWSTCTVTCGIGIHQRYRECNKNEPYPYEPLCNGHSVEVGNCNSYLCYSVRLTSGRLEINLNGEWGTVCDDEFDELDAHVACKMLGFIHTGNARVISKPDNSSSMPIWLDDLLCHGFEDSLLECSHNGIGVHNCNHGEDVGVDCKG